MTYHKYRVEISYTVRADDTLHVHRSQDMYFAGVANYVEDASTKGFYRRYEHVVPQGQRKYSIYIPASRIYQIEVYKVRVSEEEYHNG